MAMIEITGGDLRQCILCAEDINKLENKIDTICDFCNERAYSTHQCNTGHYICDTCYNMSAYEYVKKLCTKYQGFDPIELAVQIMNSPAIKMHGPEHHYIVPAVLLTCAHNAQHLKEDLKSMLETAERRAQLETPNNCSYKNGECGAAMGAGVFLSIYLGHNLADEDEWSPVNEITAVCLKKIADSEGPRCCKRDTYLSLQAATEFLKEKFAIDMPVNQAKCTFSLRNRTCGHEDCSFYNISYSLV